MDSKTRNMLSEISIKVRLKALEGIYNAKSGHPGGSLSVADLLTYLYFVEMNIKPEEPKWENRDRLVLSKGHAAPALYAVLAYRGYFSVDELASLRKFGHMLQGHPDMRTTPGIDMSTGSLGQGISAACGMAVSANVSGQNHRIYTILGDGEIEEGQVWEAAMFAGHYKLDNLIAIVDYNGLQIDGKLSQVCSPEPISDKFASFGWHVIETDAHNFDEIEKAFEKAKNLKNKPVAIIQKSFKGSGISFMEDNPAWHGVAPNKEDYELAVKELEEKLVELQ